MSRFPFEQNSQRGSENAAFKGARRADALIKGVLDGSAARSQQLEKSQSVRLKWLEVEKLIDQGLSRFEARAVLGRVNQEYSESQRHLDDEKQTEDTSTTDMMSAFVEAGIEVPQHLIAEINEIPTESGRAEWFYSFVRELAKNRGTAQIVRLVATLAIATGLFGAFSNSVNARVDQKGNEQTPSSLFTPDLRSDLGEANLQTSTALTETASMPASPEIQSSATLTVTKSFMASRAEDSVRMIIPAKKTITDVVGTQVVLEPNQPPSVGLEFTYLDKRYTATMTLDAASTTFDSSSSVTTTVEALQVLLEPEYIGVVTTSGGAVNLREKPTTSSAVAGSLGSGETLFVMEQDSNTNWYKVVDTDGAEKWVSGTVVAFTSITENTGGSPVDSNLRLLVEKITGVEAEQIDLVYPSTSIELNPSLAIDSKTGKILGSFQELDDEVKFVPWQMAETGSDVVPEQATELETVNFGDPKEYGLVVSKLTYYPGDVIGTSEGLGDEGLEMYSTYALIAGTRTIRIPVVTADGKIEADSEWELTCAQLAFPDQNSDQEEGHAWQQACVVVWSELITMDSSGKETTHPTTNVFSWDAITGVDPDSISASSRSQPANLIIEANTSSPEKQQKYQESKQKVISLFVEGEPIIADIVAMKPTPAESNTANPNQNARAALLSQLYDSIGTNRIPGVSLPGYTATRKNDQGKTVVSLDEQQSGEIVILGATATTYVGSLSDDLR